MNKLSSLTLAALLLAPLAALHAAEHVAVPRWQPHDFAFHANSKTPNPFLGNLGRYPGIP